LYGFLAVLIARETAAARRWLPYLGAALIVMPLAFSQLYLGANWLSDILASLSLGIAWVALLGLGYNRHRAPPVGRSGLLLVCCATLVLADLPHLGLHHQENVQRYQARVDTKPVEQAAWWRKQWRRLPAYRIDFSGDAKQALSLQWAATREELERRLAAAGWQPAPALNLENALHGLNPAVNLEDLPVLPRVHDGRHADLVLIHPGPEPNTRWTLRFWDAGVRLEGSGTPIWLGSFGLQKLQQRVGFLSFPVYVDESETPMGLLGPALEGLRVRTVEVANNQRRVTLVDDGAG
jgi:undecaprenyl-diphosphatase